MSISNAPEDPLQLTQDIDCRQTTLISFENGATGANGSGQSAASAAANREELILPECQKKTNGFLLLLGITTLLPFNSSIVPADYFTFFYPSDYFVVFSMLYAFGNWCSTWAMLKHGDKLNSYVMILTSFIVWLCILVIIPFITFIVPDPASRHDVDTLTSRQTIRLVINSFLSVTSGVFSGIAFPMIFSVASRFGAKQCYLFLLGSSLAGLVAVVINILVSLIGTFVLQSDLKNPGALPTQKTGNFLQYSTLTYFLLSAGLMGASIYAWIWLMREYPFLSKDIQLDDTIVQTSVVRSYIGDRLTESIVQRSRRYSTLEISKMLTLPGSAVLVCLMTTYFVFPGMLAMAEPSLTGILLRNATDKTKLELETKADAYSVWWLLAFMANYLLFDWLGRTSTRSACCRRIEIPGVLTLAIIRVIFIPVFAFFSLPAFTCKNWTEWSDPSKCKLPMLMEYFYLHENTAFVWIPAIIIHVLIALFALSNGHLTSVTMMKYHKYLPDGSYDGEAGRIMSLFYGTGTFAGAMLSLSFKLIFD